MAKPIPAIVESQHEDAFAIVRAKYAELREADVQVERTEKRSLDAQRIAASAVVKRDELRLEVGKALLRARQAWPERGPKAKGWGEFLKREGIEQSTAWRYMEAAQGGGFHAVHENSPRPGTGAPHPAEQGDERGPSGQIPASPRKPLGLLADIQLWLGRWEDVLSKDEIGEVDTVISDTPYSKRTHAGGREGQRADGHDDEGLAPEYAHWDATNINAFVESWSPRCRGWMVSLCDHYLIPDWTIAYERMGRYVFAPVPCVISGMTVRLAGDGPSSWCVYAIVARPSTMSKWGTLPGAYTGGREAGAKGGRGKPRWLMDALVRDYSRPGDLVCDPLAGYGTTLISALLQRRRAIGAEVDQHAIDEAHRRANALNEEPITETAA